MDEIDNIILHSLRQIDCDLDEDIKSLDSFTPALLVQTVSKCLSLIDATLDLPRTLPPGMAQRFTVTARLAEACSAVGYRRDIGYQTFLYSNVAEVRRVLMFLIEQLPKEPGDQSVSEEPIDKVTALETRIYETMRQQLLASWKPDLCMGSSQMSNRPMGKKVNLPFVTQSDVNAELKEYWMRRSGFWNDVPALPCDEVDKQTLVIDPIAQLQEYYKSNQTEFRLGDDIEALINRTDSTQESPSNALDNIVDAIEAIKAQIQETSGECIKLSASLGTMQESKAKQEKLLIKLKEEKKIKERTHILLEDPEVNVMKLEAIIAAAGEKMKKLQDQWEAHRTPLLASLEEHQAKNSDKVNKATQLLEQIDSARQKSEEVIIDLQTKSTLHARLLKDFEKMNKTISRTAYTGRIMEIIGNIRKQKTDIDKILQDTRTLQKEINLITGQLDRQFTVTDDLIFRNAKRDEYSKRAYKLLITLHSDCTELIALVQETGAVKREVRDLEDQIENEKGRNVITNLSHISQDLEEMQTESHKLEEAIRQLEVAVRTQ